MYRALILSVLAGPAWAVCPVADDLQTGIRLIADDGTVETYRAQGPHVVELTVAFDDGYADQSLLAQGVYVLEVAELIDGRPDHSTRLTYDYPVKAEAMPVPEPGAVWRTRAVLDGADDEKITATWGKPIQMTYGDCSYHVIPGEIVHKGTGYGTTEGLHYLPELGFAYLASFATDDDDFVNEYAILSITALEQDE